MVNYSVRAIGADFEADDEGSEYISAEVAKQAAVKSAIAIATDEIVRKGKKSSIIEALVQERGTTVGRYVIALTVEALPLGAPER